MHFHSDVLALICAILVLWQAPSLKAAVMGMGDPSIRTKQWSSGKATSQDMMMNSARNQATATGMATATSNAKAWSSSMSSSKGWTMESGGNQAAGMGMGNAAATSRANAMRANNKKRVNNRPGK